ncbi:aminotransferase class I/II-fold pyridoxal phosphate-dependent enzyme [Candidatus Woesearchaeota archaeon]|nr:aminotransferase class I/II-fold pyridoxal phosphate-dependent enzyme [Candidatus Woesearchaeota archaeon]
MFRYIQKEAGYLIRRMGLAGRRFKPAMNQIEGYTQTIKDAGLYPDKFVAYSGPDVKMKVSINGKKPVWVTQFCANNSLGLAVDPEVVKAAEKALQAYKSTSCSGSPALCGKIGIHEELEEEIAGFKQNRCATLFMTGWMANIAIVDAIANLLPTEVPGFRNDEDIVVFSDRLNHASIVAGLGIAKIESMMSKHIHGHVKVIQYNHNDVKDLENKIKKYIHRNEKLMVVSDAVFSMDGDIAPLPEILELAGKYRGVVVMDEAHSTGTIGKTGRGIVEHFGLSKNKVESSGSELIHMTTLSKFAAGVGGCVISNNEAFNDLMHISPYHIYTSVLPPSVAAGCLAAFRKLRKNPQLVTKLQKNSAYMRNGLKEMGFDVRGETHVIPVVLPGKTDVHLFGKELFEKHRIFVSAVYAFAASPRLRLTASAMHTKEDTDLLLSSMETVGKKFNVIG